MKYSGLVKSGLARAIQLGFKLNWGGQAYLISINISSLSNSLGMLVCVKPYHIFHHKFNILITQRKVENADLVSLNRRICVIIKAPEKKNKKKMKSILLW